MFVRAAGGLASAGVSACVYVRMSWPKFPTSEERRKRTGFAYDVGSTRLRLRANNRTTVAMQIFYPCETALLDPPHSDQLYCSTPVVEGLSEALGNLDYRFFYDYLIGDRSHHLPVNAPPTMPASSTTNSAIQPQQSNRQKKWPVVIFSHGLYGNMDM